jgi:hypothetical protein
MSAALERYNRAARVCEAPGGTPRNPLAPVALQRGLAAHSCSKAARVRQADWATRVDLGGRMRQCWGRPAAGRAAGALLTIERALRTRVSGSARASTRTPSPVEPSSDVVAKVHRNGLP